MRFWQKNIINIELTPLKIKDFDLLILKFPKEVNQEQLSKHAENLKNSFKGINVLCITNEIKIEAVKKND